jgi:hypothetical protein
VIGALAPAAHAADVYGIWWMPDDSDDDGWGVGLREKRPLSPLLSYDLRTSWVSFSTPDANMFPLEGTVMARLGMLYVGAGGGYYIVTGDNGIENDIGWYFLAGVELLPGPMQIFGEVKWQNLSPDVEGGGSVNLDALVIHAGVSVNMPRR